MAVVAAFNMPGIEGDQKPISTFFTGPPRHAHATNEIEQHLQDVDMNQSRRKRQKTDSPDLQVVHPLSSRPQGVAILAQSDEVNSKSTVENTKPRQFIGVYGVERKHRVAVHDTIPGSNDATHKLGAAVNSPTQQVIDSFEEDIKQPTTGNESNVLEAQVHNSPVKPKKILKFNPKTGTIGSPPAKKFSEPIDGLARPKRAKKRKSLVVRLLYKAESRDRIEAILNRQSSNHTVPSLPIPGPPPMLKQKRDLPVSTKSTHPFFLGKLAPKSVPDDIAQVVDVSGSTSKNSDASPKPSFSSPSAFQRMRAANPKLANELPRTHIFGSSNHILKFPGAAEPLWPPQDMLHIRGHNANQVRDEQDIESNDRSERKSKYAATVVNLDEDLLETFATRLSIGSKLKRLRCMNTESFQAPDRDLRLPLKHFESGRKLQRRIKYQLKSVVRAFNESDDYSEDDLCMLPSLAVKTHPAISKLYRSLTTSLSAFDRSAHETQSWTQKYAPATTADVLQIGREPYILKEWLQALTVVAVESRSAEDTQNHPNTGTAKNLNSKGENRPKKKRKSKLDDFIVSSDDGDSGMSEVSDIENSTPCGSQELKRTVVRSKNAITKASKGLGKLSNAVVISGPNGSGKTAMVYAVAKELGFDIFEINAGARRSGKDILDRVGDMTKNHLVRGSQARSSGETEGMLNALLPGSTAADIESGRQGTFNSFFKPKAASKLSAKIENPPVSEGKSRAQPKKQRQSLILLEEADILYEEDKQFWATVMGLMLQSKRPVIMTCNDENTIPLQALSLHAILRVTAPPMELAVDYTLLVAANEGHALERQAVQSLYQSRNFDLRACLTELEVWCQMGVGDQRGGLEWFYPRWPRGCDVDEDQRIIRVISGGTYKSEMSWLGSYTSQPRSSNLQSNEKLFQEAWHNWQIHPQNAYIITSASKNDIANGGPSRQGKIEDHLCQYEAAIETLSLADICSSGLLADGQQRQIDTSIPSLSLKARSDYIIGYEVLEATEAIHHDVLAQDIALYLMSSAAGDCTSVERALAQNISHVGWEGLEGVSRKDFSLAFDPIAEPDNSSLTSTISLECSVFDRPLSAIALDVAPYVRTIVDYDLRLQQERAKLSNLLSEGGRPGKRMRTTRSALSALEGGARRTTRKEKYFDANLNAPLVLKTGKQIWQDALRASMAVLDCESVDDIANSSEPDSIKEG